MDQRPSGFGKLVLLIGPSGVGKSMILKHLRTLHPEMHFPRSATTRPRREGEGTDLYRFVTDAEFDALLERSEVLEWAVVHGGARYGTLRDEIVPAIEQGKTVVREVDVQGFKSIRAHADFAAGQGRYRLQSIFVLPESREQLIDHITKRAPITPEELERRLRSMQPELEYAKECDARVLNREGRLEDTVAEVSRLLAA